MYGNNSNNKPILSDSTISSETEEVLETIITTNITNTDNVKTKTSNTNKPTTTKETTQTTTTTTLKSDKDDYVESTYIESTIETEEIVEEYVFEESEIETENFEEETSVDIVSNESYYGSFEATWYEGGVGTYGYSGRDLISGYSVASNYFAQGTTLRIVGGGLDGIYRVDDRGGMADNVVDFYYQYGDVPSDFRYHGRVNIEVYVIE
jgi:hypothetical protein